MKSILAPIVLLAFTAYSLVVVAQHGYTGFLSLAGREPWALQMLLDLVIACSFAVGWMIHDARRHQLVAWPFAILTVFFGSVGLLGYVVWRDLIATGRRAAAS